MDTLSRIPQGACIQAHLDHVATSAVHGLGDCGGHFSRLAVADSDATVTVANHGQCRKAELPTALDHLGHAIDRNQLFQQAITTFVIVRHATHL